MKGMHLPARGFRQAGLTEAQKLIKAECRL